MRKLSFSENISFKVTQSNGFLSRVYKGFLLPFHNNKNFIQFFQELIVSIVRMYPNFKSTENVVKPYKTNGVLFTLMGILKSRNSIFGVSMILLCSIATASSATFVYKNFSVNLEAALSAVFQVIGLCSSMYVLTNALIFRHRIARIFAITQQIYDAGISIIYIYIWRHLKF